MGKSFKVSKGYTKLYFAVAVIMIASFCMFWLWGKTLWYWYLISGIYFLLFLWTVRFIFTDALCGSFSVDEKGIAMHTGLRGHKSYFHSWESITDCGTTWNRNANDGGAYCIYFATRHLTIAEKQKFLNKTRFDLDSIAWFQYSASLVEELYPLLPPEIAAKLRENVELVDSSMNKFERRHHK